MKVSRCLVTSDLRSDESGSFEATFGRSLRRRITKSFNMLAAVLLPGLCGCGHTYFAWNKPLSVEHTEPYPLPPPGLLDWRGRAFSELDFGQSHNRADARRDMQRSMNRAVRSHFPKR